jgi:predicted P-loop ATPase
MEPGIKADMVPLIGVQGARKSTGVRLISPFAESYASFNLNDKDDVLARKMRGCIVGELEELRGLHGRDAESTKAFFSSPHDEWVPKFKEFKVRSPRRVVFIGTTNNPQI